MIYDLKVGDSYWRRIPTGKVCVKIEDNDSYIDDYQHDLMYGNVYLTDEDCQQSIDYSIALAKINKRAHELGNNKDDIYRVDTDVINGYTISDDYFVGAHVHQTYYNNNRFIFSSHEIATTILKELPEEVSIILKGEQ